MSDDDNCFSDADGLCSTPPCLLENARAQWYTSQYSSLEADGLQIPVQLLSKPAHRYDIAQIPQTRHIHAHTRTHTPIYLYLLSCWIKRVYVRIYAHFVHIYVSGNVGGWRDGVVNARTYFGGSSEAYACYVDPHENRLWVMERWGARGSQFWLDSLASLGNTPQFAEYLFHTPVEHGSAGSNDSQARYNYQSGVVSVL